MGNLWESTNPSFYTDLNGNVSGILRNGKKVFPGGFGILKTENISIYDIVLADYDDKVDVGVELSNPYYDGSTASKYVVHPSLLFIPEGWNGYKYWLVYTPYYNMENTYENPCMVVSNDTNSWTVPEGLTNPIIPSPGGSAYNSDPCIYIHTDGVMYMMYRVRSSTTNSLMLIYSSNGISWSTPLVLKVGAVNVQDYASPSFWHDGTNWVCFFHNLDVVGYPFQRMTAVSILDWSGSSLTTMTMVNPNSTTWWHSHFKRLPSGSVIGIICEGAASGGTSYLIQTADMINFSVLPLKRCATDYKSTFVIIDEEGNSTPKMFFIFGRLLSGFHLYKTFARVDGRASRRMLATNTILGTYAIDANSQNLTLGVDSFTGTPGNDLATTLDGKTWVQVSADTIVIDATGTKATNENTSNCRAYIDIGIADFSVQAKFTYAPGGQMWIMFRYIDSSNFWRVGVQAVGALRLQSVIAGGIVNDIIISHTFTNGDVFRVRCDTSMITLYINEYPKLELISLLNITGTKVGLQASTVVGSLFDDFVAHKL